MIDLDKKYWFEFIERSPGHWPGQEPTHGWRTLKNITMLVDTGMLSDIWIIDADGFDSGDRFTDE